MIFPLDHNPPHVHAFGPQFRLKLAIADGRVIEAQGTIGARVIRRLQTWTIAHRERLGQLWADAVRGNPIGRVED